MADIKKTATYGEYVINVANDNSIEVLKNGVVCDVAKAALRDIASLVGFSVDPDWNTRQLGAKLVDFLNENNPAPSASAPKVEPKQEEPKQEEPKSTPAESFKASAAESASAKVRVYGKAQNRTALGIAHAYMVMFPHATLDDLRKAFPNELNPDKGVKENFIYADEKGTTADWNGYFKGEDEVLTMGDGKKVAVVSMWTKPSFERIVSHARVYDIVVAQFDAADKGGKKGGFRLEYLNGYVPPVPEKKKSLLWLWILLAALIIGAVVFFALPKEKVVEVEKIVEVEKVVYIDRVEEIEKNFNAATFIQGKADLSEDAKFVLHDLAQLMQKHPELKLQLIGHTSSEGDPDFNQRLSEARAQAAVDFLVSRGIGAERLEAIGKGSSEIIDHQNPEANRRTEFIVIE